jgi:hypothetical protein
VVPRIPARSRKPTTTMSAWCPTWCPARCAPRQARRKGDFGAQWLACVCRESTPHPCLLRPPAHDSGLECSATAFPRGSCIRYLPALTGAFLSTPSSFGREGINSLETITAAIRPPAALRSALVRLFQLVDSTVRAEKQASLLAPSCAWPANTWPPSTRRPAGDVRATG